MGQKSSTLEEPHNTMFPPEDILELGLKSNDPGKLVDGKIEPTPIPDTKEDTVDVKNVAKSKQQLESGDPPMTKFEEVPGEKSGNQHKRSHLIGKLLDEYVGEEGVTEERYFTKTCLNPDFLPLHDNPSVEELSQLTALKMMQNFEEFAKLDQFWKSQVSEIEDKAVEDDRASEEDFRMINYEELPTAQLVENQVSTLKQDSSTTTNEIKESARNRLEGEIELDKSCEQAPGTPEPSILNDVSTASSEEMLHLRMRVSMLECERDEAVLRTKLVEERYEAESRCLEAVEEKLRSMISELGEEVRKSKSLERQLNRSLEEFTPQSRDNNQTEALANVD